LKEDDCDIIDIPEEVSCKFDKKLQDDVMMLVLKYLYYNQDYDKIRVEVSSANCFALLAFSNYLKIDGLVNQLKMYVKTGHLGKTNCVRTLYELLPVSIS
jgi:hypothetical protein